LYARGLFNQYQRLFDEDGSPKNLPLVYANLVAAAIASGSSDNTADIAEWIRALPSAQLLALLKHNYMGKPRLRFTEAELKTDFNLLPFATEEQKAAEEKAKAAEEAAAQRAAINRNARLATNEPHQSITLKFTVPPPQAKVDPYAGMSETLANALREEDKVFELLSSDVFAEAVDGLLRSRFNNEVLRRAHSKLRNLSWKHWPGNNGNPFVLRITEANCEEYGVPDYFKFISSPMDLTRIDERISRSFYVNPTSFFKDTDLISYNAKVFNGPDCSRGKNPRFPLPAFYVPKSPESKKFQECIHPHSVYGMAFEFEREAVKLQAPVTASFQQLLRICRRSVSVEVLRRGGHVEHKYLSEASQSELKEATSEWAKLHAITLVC